LAQSILRNRRGELSLGGETEQENRKKLASMAHQS